MKHPVPKKQIVYETAKKDFINGQKETVYKHVKQGRIHGHQSRAGGQGQ